MGVSFRVEPLALLDAWRGMDGGFKTVDDSWRVRALRAEEALRAERKECGDCHKRRATAEAALEEHTRWLGEERSAKAALEQELNDLKAHMEKKIQELTATAEKDRVKAKRSLDAAIEAANRVTKQNALDERRKRDQLEDLNAKLKKDIIELEKVNTNARERISKLEIELKSSYDIKSSINISISTNEAFAQLEDDKHKLEIENAALKESLDGKSKEVNRLKDELSALRERINTVADERDSATKELRTTSNKLTSEIKLLKKELEQSQSITTVIERKLKETIESHVRETTIIRTKITQSEESRKRDRTKFDTDRANLRAEISRLMRLLSKAESREENVRGRKHLIEEELQVCRAKIRDLMTSDRHTLYYDSNQGVPDVERTLIERRTGLTFAHFTSRMQNYALKTRMLEYLDTIEKLRKDEVETQVQLKSKEEIQSRDNERNATLIAELRKEIATLRDASEKLDADHSAAQQAHSAHVIKSNTTISQLRQQISDGEAALQELKNSSAEAFKSAQASMESQKQAAADSLELLESSLKSKDAEILELKTGHASYTRDIRSRDEKIDSLSDRIAAMERELESRTAELSDRRAALGVAKWRASIRGTSLKNAYDALLVKLTNTETELKSVCELREKDQQRVQALENEITGKYPARAADGETAAAPSTSEADQLKMIQLEKQCKQLRAKNEEDVAKYRRLLREKDKEFTLVKQNEAAKLREAYNIINTQSVDLSRLDIKSKQLEVAVFESTKSTLMAEQQKVSVTKSIREVTQRCQILEEKHIKIQHVESMRPVETRAADVSAQQLQAQIAELRLQLDFKTSESNARDKQLRGSHAANVKEWQQKVEFLQNDLLNMTASRDSAKSELLALADELSILKHQYNVNAEFSAARERDMAKANDTLRSSLDSAAKGQESNSRRSLSLQDKAEATNAELTKRNDELRAIIAKLRADHAESLDVREKRILTLEGMLQEYQSSLHETKTRYSRDLEGEVTRLQIALTAEQAAHASAIANGRSERARMRWAAMYGKSRIIQKHARFYAVSKDFSRSMKEEYRQHAAAATATIRSLDKTIKRLEKDLSDVMANKESLAERVVELEKRLAEGDSEHRSKLVALRWSHFVHFLKFKARHHRFFQNSKQFAAALKSEIRESDAFKFKNALALAARDNRIQALENMVTEYQESLHETKTRYSRDLEGEISNLRERIDVLQSELATSRWTALCSLLRTRKRHARFLNTSKDFAKSMKTEYRLHAEGTTKTVRSLGDTIAALKKELADMASKNKSLEGAIAKSKTDLEEMHKQSRQFETQIEQMQGEMFQTDVAMKARDDRIGVLEGMVEGYQSSLHETKTAYSRSLEQEIKDIRDAWTAEAEAHAASKRDRVRIRWSMLANELRLRKRGIRFTHTARDFAKSMRTEYRLHTEGTTKTVRSLGDTIAALKKELEDSKKSKSKADEEVKMLRKRRDDELNAMKKRFEEAEKNRAAIEKQCERTINSLNDEIRNLKKQLENEAAKSLGMKKASEARIEELQQLIASLEDGMKELQSSAESTKSRLSSEESRLRSECATLRNRLDEMSSLYAGLQETSSAKLAAARWRLLLTNVKQRDRHDKFFGTSKDFSRGMRADHKLYVEFTQRTITSLNESNAKLKQRADDAAKKEEAYQAEIATLKSKMASDEAQARMKVKDLEEKISESGKLAKQLNKDLDTLDKDSKKRYDEAVKVSRREADALRETIRDLEKKLDNANRSARKTDEKNKSEVEKLRAKFESLKKKDVDQRRITELEALVKRLEASIDEHEKLLTAARHTHKDEIEEKDARINELELERQRLVTAISEYETSLESTRSSSSGQVSRLHGELRILREQLDESNTTRAKALVQAKSERAALHWSWMCRVLRARRLHQRHVALVKSFTSAELVEARSWAATCDKTIRSLNDQMLEAKAKLKELEDLDETVRVRDARIAELELLLQEAQSSMDSTKSNASSELQRLKDENANLVSQFDDLRNKLVLDAEKAKGRAESMKSDYDKQIEDLRARARMDADESAAREHQAQVDFKNQLDDLAERLKNKAKSDATFEHARFLQMKEEYEKQLEDLRKRMKADADSAEARAQQSQVDFEQQLADLAEVHKKDSAVVKFRQASAMGLRDKRIHELEALLLESQNDWEALKSTSTGDVITLRRELAESRSQIESLQAQWSADEEAKRVARIIELEKDVNGYKIALQAAKGETGRAADDITALQKSVSDLKELLKVSSEEKLTLASTIETLRAELEGLSSKTSKASNDGDALRSRLAGAEKALVDAEARALSQRATLRWSWMCRVLRARRLHQRHVALVKSFTSAELVEARSWAATCDKTIRSLNDQMLEAKAKLKALDDADARVKQLKAEHEAQLRAAADEAAERELEAQANFKTLLESLSARHKSKAASDAEDSESRYQLMVTNFEQQLGELRERMRAEAADAAKRAEQAHADFEQQMADLVQVRKKELTVLKFRHASTLGLRDSRVEELERLLLEHETELEKSKSSMSGDAITTRRELSELRMQYDDFKAQSAADAEDAARVAQRLEQELDVLRKRCVSLERAHDDAMMQTKSERAALRWRTTCRILQVKEGHRRFLNIALGHSKATLRELVAHRNTAQITIHSLQDKLDGMQKRLAGATESEASSEARERTLQEEIINLKLKISQLEKEKIRVSYEMTKSQAIIGQRDETISDLEKMLLSGGEQSVGLATAQEKIKRLERDYNDLQSRAMADAASAAKRFAAMEGKKDGLDKSERAQLRWVALLRYTIRDVRIKRLLSLASSFAGSLKAELKLHGEVATKTIKSLQADLDELRKQVNASANEDDERKMLETKLAALQEKLAELKAKQSIIPSLQSELDALKAKSAEHVSEKERLEKELDSLRQQLSDAERVKGGNTGVNDELVKTLRQRISELEQEIISLERKHAAAVEKIISDHNFAIDKEIKDRENAARDYARIIEDLEGDLVEMTDSRDVAVSDMMKLRLRLDELERGAKDKSRASSSSDPDLLREIHVLRTKVEHLETELVTERTKREREVHTLREKLSSREREATAATNATNVASEETMRVKKELQLKITSQTTLIERLELQVKELKAEYESTQNELGAEAERVSSKSVDLINAGKKLNDENASLREQLDEALAELERLRVAKDFITKEFNFFQIEARQNADLIQRKLERTQEQLNDAEVELAKLRAQVQEYAAEQEELMFESQRIQKASDAKITKLRSELSNVRIEYEEDMRGKLATLKERISDLEDELSDEREKSAKAIEAAKLEASGATGDSAATQAKIHDLEIELVSTREEITTLEEEIKSSQEAVEYAENWARMNDKRAQGAEEFLITLKVEIAELKRALVLAKSQPHDDGAAELQKLLDECHETCKSQLTELNELRSERDKLMARPEPKKADPNVGSTTVNFDLGDEPAFEMPEIPKRPEPEPVEPIRRAPSPTPEPTVVYDVEESMERRYGERVEIATTYETEVEHEPSEDEPEEEEEPGYLEETEEILEIVEYDSDGNEIIVESRALAPGESVDEHILDKPEEEPEQPVARRSGLWGRFGGAVDDIME